MTPVATSTGVVRLYWLRCQRCFASKGRSVKRLCRSCGNDDRRKLPLKLACACGRTIDRDALIQAMYMAGMSSPRLGELFGLSGRQVLNIIREVLPL